MNKLRIISRTLVLALIPVTMLLVHNQLSNWHYHVLPSGIIVKHAHPYNKADNNNSPFGKHKHSDFEFFILGQIAALSVILLIFLFFFADISRRNQDLIPSRYLFPFDQQQKLSLRFLRAPPAS